MTFIRLIPSASVTPTEVGVILRSDLGTFQLSGPDIRAFVNDALPLLNGRYDRDAIAAALGEYSRESVLSLLGLLEQRGLLEDVPEAPDVESARWRGQADFFQKWGGQPEAALQRLREARVLVVGLEPWGVTAAVELAASGIGNLHLLDDATVTADDLLSARAWTAAHLGRPRGEALRDALATSASWSQVSSGPLETTADRCLVIPDGPYDLILGALAPDELFLLDALARTAQVTRTFSLTGSLDGLDAIIGPAVMPGDTACWNCARLRQLATDDHPAETHALQAALLAARPAPRTRTYLAPMAPLLGQLLALEAIKLITGYAPSKIVGRLLVQNLVSLETTLHTIVRMPWCDVCGGASAGGAAQPGGAALSEPEEGSPRDLSQIEDPTDLRDHLAGWVDERTGIIRYLAVGAPGAGEPELPITATAVLASYTQGLHEPHPPELGSGKGLTTTQAMIGAVGEAIERYSAARYRVRDLHRASLTDVQAQDDALDPRRLCLYTEFQYTEPDFPYSRFDPDQPLDWTKGRWLDTNDPVWLPALPTFFNYRARPGEQFCQVTSNGLAAGADVEDAAIRAIFELVERDAFMLTWLARRPGRRVMLDRSIEPGVHEAARQLQEQGASLELYLLDAGLGIPAVACLGLGDGTNWPAATISLAAHADPATAVRKAILEQGHVGPYVRRLMRDPEQRVPERPEDVRTLSDHALYYTRPERLPALDSLRHGGSEPIPVGELAAPCDASLASVVALLSEAGVRVAAADLTSPDVALGPFRVARALGTDMQPIHFGFKLRRLANPRLTAILTDGLHPHPHPVA